MKTTKKRILALVLVALMVMFNVPFVGFADPPGVPEIVNGTVDNNVTTTRGIHPLFYNDNNPGGGVEPDKDGQWHSIGDGVSYKVADTEGAYLEWKSEDYYIDSIIIKGGKNYYQYNYTNTLIIADSLLRSPDNGGGQVPSISHYEFDLGNPIPKGSLTLTKNILHSEKYVNAPEGKFWFQLYRDGNKVNEPFFIETTNHTGSITINQLQIGNYVVKELDETPYLMPLHFTVKENNKSIAVTQNGASVTIENEYTPKGSFTITKNMSSDSDPLPNDKIFTFDIYEIVDNPQVPNEIGDNAQVAPIQLPFKTASLTIGKGLTTASASVELPYGSYFVSERDAKNPGSSFSLLTPFNNRIDITINGSNGQQAVFTNKYVAPTGVITVIKRIEQAQIVPSALPLNPNFAFDIINVETDEVVQSFTLPQNGLYQFTSASLPLGTYKVHEKSMDPGFKVVENDKTVVINHEGAAVSPYMVTIENLYDPNLGNLIIKKVVESTVVGGPIPGVSKFEFELRKDDAVVKVDGKDSFFIDTLGGNGQVTLNGLEAGTYTINEINLGYNYTVSPAAVTVTVDAKATVTAQTITNYYTPDPEIQIEVLKVIVDANGSPVSSQNNVNFTLALEPTEPTSEYDYEVLATKTLQRTTFKNLFTFSVNAKDKDALSYQKYPNEFTRAYTIKEADRKDFTFKSFKIDYYFGDEVVTETTTENNYVVNLFEGRSFADKIVITVTNIYTPDTPPVIPPDEDEPRERRIIPTEPVPLASPTTEAAVPEEVPEELLPLAPVTLPKTGEVPATLFYGIGGMISALGVFLRRR